MGTFARASPDPNPTQTPNPKIDVALTGVSETALMTLQVRAQEALRPALTLLEFG